MSERNGGKLVAGGGHEVGAAGSGFSSGHSVLEALELFQARLVTEAGLHAADGLKVILPERLFDALVGYSFNLRAQPAGMDPSEITLNLSGGQVVVRRASPYQPLHVEMPGGGTLTFIQDPKLRPSEPRPYRPQGEATMRGESTTGPEPFMKTVDRLASEMVRATGERTNRFVMDMHAGIPSKPAVKRVYSPNFNERSAQVDVLLLHHTGGTSTAGAVLHLCDPSPKGGSPVSAHYVVSPEGFVWQLVDDDKRAWHAGQCEMRGVPTDMNSRSIGIELVNPGDGKTPFTEAQYAITRQLVAHLQARYTVPWENVLGHRDVAVPRGRKMDPADNFEWHRVLPHEESLRRGLLQPTT